MDVDTDWTVQIIYAIVKYFDDDFEYGQSGWAIHEWFTDKLEATIVCQTLYGKYFSVREYKALRNETTGEYCKIGDRIYIRPFNAGRLEDYYAKNERERIKRCAVSKLTPEELIALGIN